MTARIAAPLVVVAALLLAGAGGEPPPSGTLQDGEHAYQVVIGAGWQPATTPEGTLVAYREAGGRGHLAITRVEVGRMGEKHRARMIDEVERGVERETSGYKRLKRSLTMEGIVPILDLWYERSGSTSASASAPRMILMRYLFFRRHTVVLSIGLPARPPRDLRRASEVMLKSFKPFVR